MIATQQVPSSFRMAVEQDGSAAHARLYGEFDLASRPRFEQALAEVPFGRVNELVLDLRRLSFIDSTGLRMILEVWNRSRRDGFELSILPGPDAVQRVFEVTGLDGRLPIANGSG